MATAKTKKVNTDRVIELNNGWLGYTVKSQNPLQSDDYKDRLKAEYYQLKDRLEKLSAALEKCKEEVGENDAIKRQYIGYGKTSDIKFIGDPNPSLYLLSRQKRCMTEYLHILEKRAEIEKIKL